MMHSVQEYFVNKVQFSTIPIDVIFFQDYSPSETCTETGPVDNAFVLFFFLELSHLYCCTLHRSEYEFSQIE